MKVSTVIRSKEAQVEMTDFLLRNWRDMEELVGEGGLINLWYTPRGDQIGFHLEVSGRERTYAFILCQWIALKVGALKQRLRMGADSVVVFPEPVPYILYGDHNEIPVLLGEPSGVIWGVMRVVSRGVK